jgi:spermidine synthase
VPLIAAAFGLGANAVLFYLVARVVPGITLQAGRSLPRLALVLLVAAVLAVALPWLARRVTRSSIGRGAIVVAGEAALLLGLLAVAPALGVRFGLGGLPSSVDGAAVLALGLAAPVLAFGALAVDVVGRRTDDWLRGSAATELATADRTRLAVYALFFLSGAAGLIYEVVWARQLVLVFGNTTQAVSAILTGYFGGLAIGSVVGGRIADRVRHPLRLYGILEIVLVGVVLLTPLLFRGLHELYRSGYAGLQGEPVALALVRYGLALLALAPATVLMGATLPTLSRHLTRRRGELGAAFGRLYAMNTIGAIGGTFAAGLVLIELVGLTGALVVGATGSGLAGIAAIMLDRRSEARVVATTPAGAPASIAVASEAGATGVAAAATNRDAPPSARPSGARQLALVVAFVSGLTSLGYQLLWTRLLASGSGNTTYVFTLILGVFLVGIAVGAAIISRRMGRSPSAVALLGAMQLVVAAIVLSGLVVLSGFVTGLPFVARVLLVVLPATLALGITLPLASTLLAGEDDGIGRDAGQLLGANTLGAIGGTFVVPFALIPAIGSVRSLVVLVAVNVALGLALLVRAAGEGPASAWRRPTRWAGVALAALVVAVLAVPTPLVRDPGEARLLREGNLLAAAEDEIAAVQAGGAPDTRSLLVGGTGMTRLTVDAKLMAYLPIVTRPDAQRMLVICFGMGSTYRSGLIAGLEVDGVELVPSVLDMFRFFYDDATDVYANRDGELIVTDGRNFVELSDRTYDVITVDPPPPIESSGTSVLYSREFYTASAGRLRAGGVMMEWMPYGQSVDDFRSHVRTFADVFPHVVIGFGPTRRGVYMLGSAEPLPVDAEAVREVLGRDGVLDDLVDTVDAPVTRFDEWAAIVEGLVWIEGDAVDAFAGDAPLILDDRPGTEYFLLRRLFGPLSPPMTEPNLRATTPG